MKRLQKEGYWVRGVDIKRHEYFEKDPGDEFLIADMRDPTVSLNTFACLHTAWTKIVLACHSMVITFCCVKTEALYAIYAHSKSATTTRAFLRSFIDDKLCSLFINPASHTYVVQPCDIGCQDRDR